MSSVGIALGIALFVLVDVAIVALILQRRGKQQEDKHTVLEALSAALGSTVACGRVPFTIEGVEGEIALVRRGRKGPARLLVLKLRVPRSGGGTIRIGTEGRSTALGRKFGLLSEVTTGDREFDAKYFIDAEQPEYAKRQLMNTDLRQAVRSLSELGFTNTIEISSEGFKAETLIDSIDLKRVSTELRPVLTALSGALKRSTGQPGVATSARAWYLAPLVIASWSFAVVTFILFIVVPELYRPLDWWEIINAATPTIIVALIAWTVIAVQCSKNRFRAMARMTALLLSGWFTIVAGIPLGVGLGNAYFDQSSGEIVQASVLEKYSRRSKKSTKYYLRITGLRSSEQERTLKVYGSEYAQVTPGVTTLKVTIHPGAYGFSWIGGWEIS